MINITNDSVDETPSIPLVVNSVIAVAGEMVKDNGEDSYSYCFASDYGYIAVFDGCGGLGAKRYAELSNKTGAYLAARLTAQTTLDWFKENFKGKDIPNAETQENKLKESISENLKIVKVMTEKRDTGSIKGSLSNKSFPTTASCVVCDYKNAGLLNCHFLWAGDSRGYVLDQNGLSQITKDDIEEGQDALSNLSSDSKLENVINADIPFNINSKSILINYPAVVIMSTDGGFAYFQTPMEFEYALLYTLIKARNISEWEMLMNNYIKKFASDDYTLMLAIFGFISFDEMKKYYYPRVEHLYNDFIFPIVTERASGKVFDMGPFWEKYKVTYYR